MIRPGPCLALVLNDFKFFLEYTGERYESNRLCSVHSSCFLLNFAVPFPTRGPPMRLSECLFQTYREPPGEAELVSHQLLLRAGLVRQVASGIFAYLPLGQRVKHRIERIVREEMDAIGGQEVTLPVVQPAELWRESGRWDRIGSEMARLKDRNGRDLCLAMTHEELVTSLVRDVIRSYRQLPCLLYQVQTKFRDEPRPRGGLIRVREFTMKDGYSFHVDAEDLDRWYEKVYQAYTNIFQRCGLDAVAVRSDPGMMGGSDAHEFIELSPSGEDTILSCVSCGYRANRQVALFGKGDPAPEEPLPAEEIHTPGTVTIDDLARFLDVPETKTAKALFMVATVTDGKEAAVDRFVFAVLRGDMELSETKLANAVGALQLRPATPEEIRAAGAEPGYGSPLGIDRSRTLLVVDDLIPSSFNLVAGANRIDYHVANVNYGRDYEADLVTDIAAAGDGSPCSACDGGLRADQGIEVGNIFKLGDKYSKAMDAGYLDRENVSRPIVMGCYGIGIDRLMASIVERHHDANGICWPASVAPFQVMLIDLSGGDPHISETAAAVYDDLVAAGLEVLYDDRDDRAGVKFNDADLMGIPVRLTVGGRGVKKGVVELKVRRTGQMKDLPLGGGLAEEVTEILASCT